MGLDRQKLEAALEAGRKNTYLPFSLHLFETVSSTNQILWDLLAQGAEAGCVVIATQQTAGRGQWGRQWMSSPGGLYLSMAMLSKTAAQGANAPQLCATNSYQLTLATAWGIAKQLRSCGVPVEIKWPNDLVLMSRKLAGILTETKVHRGQITQAVIGVGMNWANPVPETAINLEMWQALQHTRPIPCLEMLISTVLIGIESGIQCLFQEGVNILISRYLELLTNMGDRVNVNDTVGTIVGVTNTGELRVRMETTELKSVKTPEICLQPGTISLGYCNSSD
ncbi:biotin--[acetyl-CoA-carboxylase] ligase [Scytonema sp. HK-05]|uniref:biotin--[acetyl-CoA-carboxylase] ligase n=1 Tax=Scytonema sp. HK-05 TaxID=1137095 RepID=UPI000936EFFB|nr:biotin--[acetyl-CoA-carboxylase] ligase [Scytonema sp. HK-05]OKH51551.1 biotin--[acetyl-CoA-carboxylase] ligase [Scytonema sp. HK-05]BAY45916.1 biotin--[acetyl-CoA-carboxylase] ligase [Scytonema sp. HK-05]